MKSLILIVPLALALGCSKQPEAYASNDSNAKAAEQSSTRAPSGDLALTAAVREAIERQVNLHDIEIRVVGGNVTLTGGVATPVEKDAAGSAAQAVPGVRAVDNQLMVKG